MSHVDEGLLHAYLDGAFPLGNAQGEQIEAHLGFCADCRVRLEGARALKERAGVVLRHAAPARVDVPPFDAVLGKRATAQQNARRSRAFWPPPVPLAWAATIVLALGAGWMANDLLNRPPGGPSTVTEGGIQAQSARAAEDLPAGPDDRSEERVDPRPSPGTGSADAAELADRAPLATLPGARGAATAGQRAEVAPPAAPQAAPATSPAGTAAQKTAADTPARNLALEQQRAPAEARDQRARAAGVAAAATGATVAGGPIREPAEVLTHPDAQSYIGLAESTGLVEFLNDEFTATTTGAWAELDPAAATALLDGRTAALEGVAATAVEAAWIGGRLLVRTSYPLGDGTVLTLIQSAERAAAGGAETAQERARDAPFPPGGVALAGPSQYALLHAGETTVWLRRGGADLLLRGAVAEDSLRATAARVHR